MDNPPSAPTNDSPGAEPAAEALQPRAAEGTPAVAAPAPPANSKKPLRRGYRPSHKATFIGLAVVFAILAINALVFGFVLKKQAKQSELATKGQVSISTADLNRLGINRNQVGDTGVQLIVAPDSQFKGKISVAGNTDVGGTLNLNGKLTGTDASLAHLQAGDTQLSKLNVNGDGTFSTLNLRQSLIVAGATQLQGAVTISQLLTVNNSLNVSGNLAVGGTLAVGNLNIRGLTINGHFITTGATPGVSRGGATGSNGTVSISGNDTSGIIGINVGVGASGGILASVSFRTAYGDVPKVIITPVGAGANFYLASASAGGFSVAVTSGLPPGGYRINYIVAQ